MKINTISDYHMHSVFSDGNASINDIAVFAMQKGLAQITITDHMPLPFDTHYAMKKDKIDQYRMAVRDAQYKYSGKLKIKMGMEFEFVPGLRPWIHSISRKGWDYAIASVHRLFIKNTSFLVNGTKTEFDNLFQMFNCDIQELYKAYYEIIQMAFNTGWFDIAGHLDVLKKHNVNQAFFNESDPLYRSLVMDTLDVIKNQGMRMEVNMSGFNHPVREQYPSLWIIRAAIKKDIPIVLSSDSHSPETIGQYFYKIDELIKGKMAMAL